MTIQAEAPNEDSSALTPAVDDSDCWGPDVTTDPDLVWQLTTQPGGRQLVALLSRIDPSLLSDDECVAFAQAVQRQQGWTDALLVQVTARFVEHRPGPPPHCESLAKGSEKRIQPGGELTRRCGSYAAAEWGAVLGTSTWSAARLIADSLDLDVRLPAMRAAVRIGMCDLVLARTLATRTRDLSAETAMAIEAAVIPLLPMTRSRLEALIDRLIARMEPAARERRVQQVRAAREVWIDATDDDHAEISGTLDGIEAKRLDSRLDELARLLGLVQRGVVLGFGPADETWQQRRARALGLLSDPICVEALVHAARAITHPRPDAEPPDGTPATSAVRPTTLYRPTMLYVHLRADGTTDLEGQGVLSLPAVRELLGATKVTVRPVLDLTTPVSSSGYRPSAEVDEAVVVRNPRCVFPYCERDSRRCQRDHTEPWPSGPTSSDNLGPLCTHHHHVKTHGRWRVQQRSPGRYWWRSPGGQRYAVDPDGTLRQSPARQPPIRR